MDEFTEAANRASMERKASIARDVEAIRLAAACKAEFNERMAKHTRVPGCKCPHDGTCDDDVYDVRIEFDSGAIVAYVMLALIALALGLIIYGSVS